MKRRSAGAVLLTLTLLIIAGCASAQYGSELASVPRPRVIESADAVAITLPQDAAFNITLPESLEQPLLNGKSDARSAADKNGTGTARAEVQAGGVAEALFRVGHAIQNGTAREIEIACAVRYAYELEVSASAATAAQDAVVGLRLYARDKQGRLLRSVPLVDHSSADGAVRTSGRSDVSIDLTLAPGATLSLFVAGRARVDVPDERSAAGSIVLRDLQMEIRNVTAPGGS